MEKKLIIEIIGIAVATIVAVGIAIYQVNSSKQKIIDKRKTASHQNIWNALNKMRVYFDMGMQKELQSIGTLKLEPIFEFRNVVNESKTNIDIELYRELVKFYENISTRTNAHLFTPMKLYLNDKSKLSQSELMNIELQVNSSREKITTDIELFMKEKRQELK
ncbi:MAG: hypothetical protein IEMM0006_1935 [bacterium]|nr:MAG: hypothetical protein IEMM0006_1935 [bacterium]